MQPCKTEDVLHTYILIRNHEDFACTKCESLQTCGCCFTCKSWDLICTHFRILPCEQEVFKRFLGILSHSLILTPIFWKGGFRIVFQVRKGYNFGWFFPCFSDIFRKQNQRKLSESRLIKKNCSQVVPLNRHLTWIIMDLPAIEDEFLFVG